MATLNLMSWNLRTFGVNTTGDDISNIANVIVNSNAHIVCIQEVQVGTNADGSKIDYGIDEPIGPNITASLDNLKWRLNALGGYTWDYKVTGANQGKNDASSMRDAYAFFYSVNPSAINANFFDAINPVANSCRIVPMPADMRWPGRRPGIISFIFQKAGSAHSQLNVVSLHAKIGIRNSSQSEPIRKLCQLPEIGGEFMNMTNGSKGRIYNPPQIATVVVGDFNYNVNNAPNGYSGLLTDYMQCIGSAANPIYTTYTPNNPPTPPAPVNKTQSSYDNIFSLQMAYPNPANPASRPLNLNGAGVSIDFISNLIMHLITVVGLDPVSAFKALYGKYMGGGVSDHLPVFQSFTI